MMQRKAFSIIHLIICLAVLAALVGGTFLLTNKQASQSTATQVPATNKDITPPSLQNLGINIAEDVEVSSQALRDFPSRGMKGLYVFGDTMGTGDPRKNPNLEFASVRKGADIIAATDGVITFIREQPDTNDTEVFLQTSDNSSWMIGYDHLTNLTVTKGQKVTAGQKLGEAAIQNNGLYRFEFQVNSSTQSGDTHVCPSTLLAESSKSEVLTQLQSVQEAWEASSGYELYDISAQTPIGCYQQELTPAQAEGR